MRYPYLTHDCEVFYKGSFVFQGTAGLCAGELLYHFTVGQPRSTDEKGALIRLDLTQVAKADEQLPHEEQAYLKWAAEHGVMELEAARRWTVGDFCTVRAFITQAIQDKQRIWLDYTR